jgi:hypothetical protein
LIASICLKRGHIQRFQCKDGSKSVAGPFPDTPSLPLGSDGEHFVLDFIAFDAKMAGRFWLFPNGKPGSLFLDQCQKSEV